MNLLVDTDIFIKLGASDLLEDALSLLNVSIEDSARLPALTYQLQGPTFKNKYGPAICDHILTITGRMPIIGEAESTWADALVGIPDIDPGEAQLFALAAQASARIMTGDKRALRKIKDIELIRSRIQGKVIVLEGILIALCERFGSSQISERIKPTKKFDRTVEICFHNNDPLSGLRSYYSDLANQLKPMTIWDPNQ